MSPMNNPWIFAAAIAMATVSAGRAAGEVVSVAAHGFELRETVHVAASTDLVYAAMITPARWWSSDHTYSGNAANLKLEARAGGCWCETLPDGGSVEHLRVVYLSPGKSLRLRGALGPFQGLGVEGAMTWSLKSAAGGTDVSWTYAVGGYAKDGFEMLSKAADGVLGAQLERLKELVEGESAPRAR